MLRSNVLAFANINKYADWSVRKKWMRGLSWLGGYFEGICSGGGLDGQAFFVVPLTGGAVLHLVGVWSDNMLPFGRTSILDHTGAPIQICEGDLLEALLHGNGRCIWFENGIATKAFEGTWDRGKPLLGRWTFAHLRTTPPDERIHNVNHAVVDPVISPASSGAVAQRSCQALVLPAPSVPTGRNVLVGNSNEVAKPPLVPSPIAITSFESLPLEPLFPIEC